MDHSDLGEDGTADHEEVQPFLIESSHPGNSTENESKQQKTPSSMIGKMEKYANAPAKAVQSMTPYLGNNAPLRVLRLKARNRYQQRAHEHNVQYFYRCISASFKPSFLFRLSIVLQHQK